jgi:hypothetical protein
VFDPTIYDNLKVILEGCVYDLDLDGRILVTNRSDRIELATMSRSWSIRFRELQGNGQATAELDLHAALADLAAELLRPAGKEPGCKLEISLHTFILDPDIECPEIEHGLLGLWEGRPRIKQQLSFEMPLRDEGYALCVTLDFGRKLDESNAEDFPRLVEATVRSLHWLNRYTAARGGAAT